MKPERFWSKIDVSTPDACWEWKAGKSPMGYGRYRLPERAVFAHRYAYELVHGPIPDGLFACHRCDNPGCVNPAHIFLGTHDDNMRDMVSKGRHTAGDKNASRKVSAIEVTQIRARRDAGETLKAIGDSYGITRQAVHLIVTRQTWRAA